MKEKKYYLYLDEQEKKLLIYALNRLRNKLIADGRYTDCVDELLIKVIYARTVKLKIR